MSPLTAVEKVERYAQENGLSMSQSWSARHLARFLGVSIKTIDRMTGYDSSGYCVPEDGREEAVPSC